MKATSRPLPSYLKCLQLPSESKKFWISRLLHPQQKWGTQRRQVEMFRGHHSHNRYNHKNFVTLCQKKNKYFLQSMNLFFVFSLYNSLSIRVVSSLKSTGQISFLPERKKINHLSLQPLEFHKYHVISPRTSITTEKTKGQL